MTNFKYEDVASKTLSVATRKALAERIKKDIDEFCIKEFTDEHRNHLGASVIGKECAREIWFGWRWVKFELFSGRMLRLFHRGHQEEARFIKWLRMIGCTVWEVDPKTGQQFRIWGVQRHYGGSSDSVGILPYFPDLPMLMEFKTHNDKSFNALVKKGVIISKPQHYKQMCSYGKHYGFRYALYMAVNKNDDDIWPEIVELNWNEADFSLRKAEDIIYAEVPPSRISDNPAYFACKFCVYIGICHYGEPVEKNCRSCRYAKPIQDGQWGCTRFNQVIPKDFIKVGCEHHNSIMNR